MCTFITALRHAGFQNGGAFIILTRSEGDERGGEGQVRISGVGAEQAGVKIRVLGESGCVDKVKQDKEAFYGQKSSLVAAWSFQEAAI